jgi:hypothetical protein
MSTALSMTNGVVFRDRIGDELSWQVKFADENEKTKITNIISDYVGIHSIFGEVEWLKYYRMLCCASAIYADKVFIHQSTPRVPEALKDFWNGPDPLDGSKRVFETHLYPVLAPEFFLTSPLLFPQPATILSRSLENLQRLAKTCKKTQLIFNGLISINVTKERAVGSFWLVMRKGVIEKNACLIYQRELVKDVFNSTGADYEVEPSAIDICTVLLAHHSVNQQRNLGDETGEEGEVTYSQSLETTSSHYRVIIGNFSESGLRFDVLPDYAKDEETGIVLMKKFPVEEGETPSIHNALWP